MSTVRLDARLIDGYTPTVLSRRDVIADRLPLFTIDTARAMMTTSIVKLGVAVREAPLLHPTFTITGPSNAVNDFVRKTLARVWQRMISKVLSALWYSRSGGELRFKLEENEWNFDEFIDVDPTDFRVLLTKRSGRFGGIRVSRIAQNDDASLTGGHVDVPVGKAFVYVHRRLFNSWQGDSELRPAYPEWFSQRCDGGAVDIERLWYWKNSYGGGVIRFPVGKTRDPVSGIEIDNFQYARQIGENIRAGGFLAMPNGVDENGQPLWGYDPPQMHSDGGGLTNYVSSLDERILRGLGIPPEIIQANGTGSFAGRTIPLGTFLATQTVLLRQIVDAIDAGFIRMLVGMNFSPEARYEVSAEIDLDKLMPIPPSQENPTSTDEPTDTPLGLDIGEPTLRALARDHDVVVENDGTTRRLSLSRPLPQSFSLRTEDRIGAAT
jgi:hypothetical protein